jgi:hypothetical protein
VIPEVDVVGNGGGVVLELEDGLDDATGVQFDELCNDNSDSDDGLRT